MNRFVMWEHGYYTIEGKTDAQRWETTLQALELLQVKDERLLTLMRAVCVVMQLGNLTFARRSRR